MKVSSIRTPVIQGRLERTQTNLMHFQMEGGLHGNQPHVFLMGQRVNSHSVLKKKRNPLGCPDAIFAEIVIQR